MRAAFAENFRAVTLGPEASVVSPCGVCQTTVIARRRGPAGTVGVIGRSI
jgi:hypothetical protein